MSKTWIVYKSEVPSAPGWEERLLMPRQSFTDILWEIWTGAKDPILPKVGSRTRDYKSIDGGFTTHGKDGDWVVARTEIFTNPDSDTRIVIAYCVYDPLEENWTQLRRGKPVEEMLGKTS
jgi:hypothetical protein